MVQRLSSSLVKYGDSTLSQFLSDSDLPSTPESFGCDTSATDNTASVIAALNSGGMVVWDKNKVYPVTGFVTVDQRSWGNNSGVMKLNTSRYGLGEVTVDFSDKVSDNDPIKGLYVESAYDLSELAFIKNMGINTLLHYGNFNVSPDTSGNIDFVYDAAALLGMRIVANTQVRDIRDPNLNIGDFVGKYDKHPAIFAWATPDEAMSHGTSAADQKAWADLIRARSAKPVTLVDGWLQLDPITPKLYDGYDIVFVDPYPQHYATGTLGERVEKDMTRIRRAFALMKAHSKTDRIVPTLGLSMPVLNDPPWPGSRDIDQNVAVAERYSLAGNGDVVAFAWDGKGDPVNDKGVRDVVQFQNVLRTVCSRTNRVKQEMEVFLVGGNQTAGHYPLSKLISRIARPDNTTIGDTWKHGNAHPVHVIGADGATESDRVMTATGWNQSGLGFKKTQATFCTDIPFREYVALHGFMNTPLSSVNGSMTLAGTYDGGYAVIPRASANIGNSQYEWVALEGQKANPEDTVCIVNTCSVDSAYYRRWFQGILLSSTW